MKINSNFMCKGIKNKLKQNCICSKMKNVFRKLAKKPNIYIKYFPPKETNLEFAVCSLHYGQLNRAYELFCIFMHGFLCHDPWKHILKALTLSFKSDLKIHISILKSILSGLQKRSSFK